MFQDSGFSFTFHDAGVLDPEVRFNLMSRQIQKTNQFTQDIFAV